jgi:hypothetical protein
MNKKEKRKGLAVEKKQHKTRGKKRTRLCSPRESTGLEEFLGSFGMLHRHEISVRTKVSKGKSKKAKEAMVLTTLVVQRREMVRPTHSEQACRRK